MGLYSFPLFVKPANIMFLPKKIDSSTLNIDRYTYYIEENIIHDIPISTGNFMQKMIDENEYGIKIYGYLLNDHIQAWKSLLTDILEQNPKQKSIEFHFYCGEEGTAFYFKAERNTDEIVFSTMVGSTNDGAYHDVSFEDNDGNEYSIYELADMNREYALKNCGDEDDENPVFVNYKFNEEKYRRVYNIKNVEFNPYVSPYSH